MVWLIIKLPSLLMRVALDEIVYVKADGNYCDLVLINGRCRKMTFQLHYFEEKFEELKKTDTFIRVGRSLIVNKQYVEVIDLIDQTIFFGGKHLQRVPTAEDLRPRTTEGNPVNHDIYTVKVSRDALKLLKEQLEQQKHP